MFSNGKKKRWIKNCSSEVSNSSRGASFSSDDGNDREALEKEIRKVYRKEISRDTRFFLQIKDEEWFGEFVDVSPSKTEIATKSILKVVLKVSSMDKWASQILFP